MNTIKKTPAQVNDRIKTWMHDTHKYKNQMNFTGIKQDDNIYAIDQESFRDSKNVYVDDNQRLVSRPSLQTEPLPDPIVLTYGGTETSVIPSTYRLIDIKDFGSGKIYISQATNYISPETNYRYAFVAYPNKNITLSTGATLILSDAYFKYHIATIEHYVICFNNINAKILDTDHWELGWQNFTNYAEIPVAKRVTGTTEVIYDKNQFIPNTYKEEYVWSNLSHPLLPDGNGQIKLLHNNSTYDLGFLYDDNTNIHSGGDKLMEYRGIRPMLYNLSLNSGYCISVAFNSDLGMPITCIATKHYVMVSYNSNSFTKIFYPDYGAEEDFVGIAEISKDGRYFFFVAKSGVYRCELSSKTWSNIFVPLVSNDYRYTTTIEGSVNFGYANASSCFLTGDVFSFITYNNSGARLYFKGNGLHAGTYQITIGSDTYTTDYMNSNNPSQYYTIQSINTVNGVNIGTFLKPEYRVQRQYNFAMSLSEYDNKTIANIAVFTYDNGNQNLLYVCGGELSYFTGDTYMYATYCTSLTYEYQSSDMSIVTFTLSSIINNLSDPRYPTFLGIMGNEVGTAISSIRITLKSGTMPSSNYETELLEDSMFNWSLSPHNYNMPLIISDEVFYDTMYQMFIWYNVNGAFNYLLPSEISVSGSVDWLNAFSVNGYIFIVAKMLTSGAAYIWTNYLLDEDSFVITYDIEPTTPDKYTDVPEVTYSDTELYLGIGNKLQITYNTKDPDDLTKTLFNLPAINNQSFIDNITGMINISTTEVALFFENKIVICSKVADENLAQGFRYDYYNTKLSTGIRLGDSVINTLEGSFTIFPTLRGLAAMNYQAFMATTDQVITYLTDIVKEMWTQFFYDSQDNGGQIKIMQWRSRIVLTNNTNTMLIYDLEHQAWWRWEVPANTLIALTDQTLLRIIENNAGDANGNTQKIFKLLTDAYYDYSEDGDFSHPIEWFALSQPIHFNAPNYYKNIKQLVFQMQDSDGTNGKEQKTMDAQIRLFRKKITTREPETVAFKIDEYRTFVKRFNYWKINELQWCLSQDEHTAKPFRLELNGISIKYELGEEVR